jgi:hypothetical protein
LCHTYLRLALPLRPVTIRLCVTGGAASSHGCAGITSGSNPGSASLVNDRSMNF